MAAGNLSRDTRDIIVDSLTDCTFVVKKMPPLPVLFDMCPGGVLFVAPDHVTHQRGSHVSVYIPEESVPEARRVREFVRKTFGIKEPGWTLGRMARRIWDWMLGSELRPRGSIERFKAMLPRSWHFIFYHAYEDRHGSIYDLRGAYWAIASRLPSPILDVSRTGEYYCLPISVRAEQRWEFTKKMLATEKPLRLSLLGQGMYGLADEDAGANSLDPRQPIHVRKLRTFFQGKPWSHELPPSGLEGLGSFVVRAAYEITQKVFEQQKVRYANADCVILDDDEEPQYWNEHGLEYRKVAEGEVEVRGVGAWRVGEQATDLYRYYLQRDFRAPAMRTALLDNTNVHKLILRTH